MNASGGQPLYHMTRVAALPHSYMFSGQEGVGSMDRGPRACSVAESIQEGMTTLMLTDLPYALPLADLRDELELLGFSHSYDYIFYPREKKQHFRGYCFINFVSTAEAQRFARVFVDHKFELSPSPKPSNVSISRTQGLQENLAKIKAGAADSDNFFMDWSRLQCARGGKGIQANLAQIKPGATSSDDFFMDRARLQCAREGSALGGSRGWYGGYASAHWSYPEHRGYETYDPRYASGASAQFSWTYQ
eukprot:TRINITY_DN3835_c0_g1_i1.p1 TRINITY_DN3835_c0_g1~~TRINITY_DN3835_c0_g1_i1.p1  ORF type:complete len:248 (-),score=39.82 TRINITY_DN3835_c0_g1_i1:196-939(-)